MDVPYLRLGIADQCFVIPLLLIGVADALGVFVQLGGVVSAGKEVLEEDRLGNADRLQVLHGSAQVPLAQLLIALKGDLADLELGAFLDDEGDAHGGRWYLPDLGAESVKLPSAPGVRYIVDNRGSLQARR